MQGTYWLTVLPETSQLRPRIKRALRGIEDPTVTPHVDDRPAEKEGRRFGEKFQKGFASSGAGKIGAAARLMGAGFKVASDSADAIAAHVGHAAAAIGIAARMAKGFSKSLLAASVGLKYAAGISLAKLGAVLGITAKLAGRLATQISRVTAAILVLAAVGKLLSFMNRAAKLMSLVTIGGAALLGVAAALATTLGQGLVSALMAFGAAAGVAAGAAVGLLGPAIGTLKLAFKGLGEGAKAFAEQMKDVWGPADEAFNKMIGQRMGPLLTQFRQLKMAVTDTFSNALTPGFNSVTGLMAGLQPRFVQLSATLGKLGSDVAASLASPATAGAFDKMFAASDTFFASLGPGISSAVSGLVQFAATAADTFKGAGVGISDLLVKFGDWLRGISPAQMIGAFAALRNVVMSVWNVLKPILTGIRDLGAVSAPALAPGFQALGKALEQAGPLLVKMAEVLMPALSQVMERLAPVIPELIRAFTPWAGVLATIAPPLASMVANLAPLAPLLMVVVGGVKALAVGMALYNTAMLIAANATKVWTAAQWLFNAAMTANPVGIVIVAVAALAAALWAFFTKTETGRQLWDKIWTGIKNTVSTVWNWLKTTLANAWTQIGPSVMKIGDVAKTAFGTFVGAVKTVWTAIQPAIAWIGRLWMSVAKLEFGVAVTALKALGATIGWLWSNVVVPAFQGIAGAVQVWWAGAQVVWGAASTAIRAVGDVIMWLWNNVAVPAFDGIKTAITTWWDGVQAVWGFFSAAVDTVAKTITTLKDAFTTGFNAIKGVVETVWNFISGIFDKIKNGVGNIVDKLRGIPGIGSLIPGAAGGGQAPGFAGGSAGVSTSGVISGPGSGTSDSILALVSNGEGIVTADAMANGGANLVAALNAGWTPPAGMLAKMLPGFAEGMVSADQLVEFAKGVEGQPYKWGGTNWGDCSGAVSAIANYATGQDPFASRFATASEGDELAKRGFQPGMGGAGSLSIGWYNGGPAGGHTAATLPDGTNFEMGGSRGNGQFGGSAAGAGDSMFTNKMHLPPEYFDGLDGRTGSTSGGASSLGSASSAGGGSYKAATSKQLSASAGRVDSAHNAVTQAGQAVDDRTFAVGKAQRRLDELKAAGKDTTDAQHSLDVANRELKDATDRQAKAKDKAAKAEQDDATLRTKGVEDASAAGDKSTSGGGFDDLGKSLWGGLMETIGLDGSVFSNPFEWPTIKSVMAGVNVLGKTLLGDQGADGTGGGGDTGGLLGGIAESTGLGDMLTNLNPAAADVAAAPAGAVAPDTTAHGTGNGAQPGPAVVIENAGMAPKDVANTLDAQWNARTRTTKVH